MTASPEAETGTLGPSDRRWGRAPARCPACDAAYLVPDPATALRCACGGALQASELALPATEPTALSPPVFPRATLRYVLGPKLLGIPLRPRGLDPIRLEEVALLVWWPEWRADLWVDGTWSAEIGDVTMTETEAQVWRDGRWVPSRTRSPDLRWCRRVGTLRRRIRAVPLAALRDASRVAVGSERPDPEPAPFSPESLQGGWIRLPEQPPAPEGPAEDPILRGLLLDDLRAANQVDQLRDAHLDVTARLEDRALRLHPTWWLTYDPEDGEGRPAWLILDGLTGHLRGPRLASLRRARRQSIALAVIGAALVLLAALAAAGTLLLPPLLLVAVPLGLVGLVTIGISPIPVARVTLWNHRENRTFGEARPSPATRESDTRPPSHHPPDTGEKPGDESVAGSP